MERKDLKIYEAPMTEIVAEEVESIICAGSDPAGGANFDDDQGGWVITTREVFPE